MRSLLSFAHVNLLSHRYLVAGMLVVSETESLEPPNLFGHKCHIQPMLLITLKVWSKLLQSHTK